MEAFIYPKKEEWSDLIARPTASYEELETLVSQVFLQVQKKKGIRPSQPIRSNLIKSPSILLS